MPAENSTSSNLSCRGVAKCCDVALWAVDSTLTTKCPACLKLASDGAALESAIGALPFARRLQSASGGEAAIVGIRPNDIRFAGGGERGLNANIAMLEPLGDVTVVSVEAGGETLRMVLPESAASGLQPGQSASVVLDPAKFHIFRASSGQVIA